MPTSWICSCSRYGHWWYPVEVLGRVSDKDIGGYEGYFLPEPAATWCKSFYTDYMTYLDIVGRDSVLPAQIASPGTQVTIQFIAMALRMEEAETKAQAKGQTLHEFLENRTIADLVEQFTQDENCEWLLSHDFFMGNNGNFATVREVSEKSHDIMMGGGHHFLRCISHGCRQPP